MKRWLIPRDDDVGYGNANAALAQAVPELKDAVAREYEYSKPDVPGPHTLYAEVLNPYVNELLDAHLATEQALHRVYKFVEQLSTSTDGNVRDVVLTTVLPNLIGEPRLGRARRFMGPATRRLLKRSRR